ncbi:hypothetical protein LL936_09915, partial [Levilactobacillus brevis]|nr:hypothetical protein [Levilactobacillus brevis]MCE6013294.1 hypothetical protein [Levilactobacillus brevis]MCE6015689.1 hypothetical protein [Levilactobacillus brevis]MCE6018111.1 hypothetical protein [Levilactobacillus brevis]MCE6023044.1 hypothetical protein [Levilactobacillus brevis]
KKNKLLSISAMNIRGKYPHFKTYVAVTLGDIHYAKINKVVYMKKLIRYTSKDATSTNSNAIVAAGNGFRYVINSYKSADLFFSTVRHTG